MIMEGSWLGGESTTLNTILSFKIIEMRSVGIFPIPMPNLEYFQSAWRMLWWDYPFLSGEWLLLKWILLYPITFAFIATIITLFASGVMGVLRR